MSASILELDIQNVTGSRKDADGFLEYVIDGYGEKGSIQVPALHPHGFWSCPLDPVVDGSGAPIPSKACSILTLTEGGVTHGMALTDPRAIDGLPLSVPGETVVYSSFGSFHRHHADGTITDSTTTTGGRADGSVVASQIAPTYFRRFAPWGRENWDETMYRLKHVGGASLTLGYAGGILPGQSIYASLNAGSGMVRITGATVGIGPSTAPQFPVAKVVPLLSLLQAMMAAIEALTAGVAAIQGGPGVAPIGAPAAAAAAAPIAIAQTALGAGLQTLSTQTAIG